MKIKKAAPQLQLLHFQYVVSRAIPDSVDIEHFYPIRKFYWMMLLDQSHYIHENIEVLSGTMIIPKSHS